MKRKHVNLIAATLTVAALGGCFDDPTSSLRNGPAGIVLSRTAAVVPIGDSTLVEARIVDEQGNILPMTGVTWTSDDPTIAVVNVAAQQLPGEGSSRAYVLGIRTLGGITTVRVTSRGMTNSIRITALPADLMGTGTFVVSGAVAPDTTVLGTAFTAGDTLTINAPSGMVFDATASVITLGGAGTQLLSRSTTQLKAMAYRGYIGRATVSDVTWLGDATTGDYDVGEVETSDSVTIARARFQGTAAVSNWVYGTNNLLTVTPGPGTTFRNTGPDETTVAMGGVNLTILSRTTTQITAISSADFVAPVRVTNIDYGTILLDSLYTSADRTLAATYWPGTVVNGGGTMMDTIKVYAGGGPVTFGATSSVEVNGAEVFVIRQTADSLYAIAGLNGEAHVTISNPVVAGSNAPPELRTQDSITVGPQTGEPNEPANDGPPGTVVAAPVNVDDTVTTYGTIDASDIDDFFTFTPGTTGDYQVVVDWANSSIDVDGFVLNSGGGGFCVLDNGCEGATGADPEIMNVTLTGGTTYTILVELWDAHGEPTPHTFRVRIIRIS